MFPAAVLSANPHNWAGTRPPPDPSTMQQQTNSPPSQDFPTVPIPSESRQSAPPTVIHPQQPTSPSPYLYKNLIMLSLGNGLGVRYERQVAERATWGGFISTPALSNSGLRISGVGADISYTTYRSHMYKGFFDRQGVRFASIKVGKNDESVRADLLIPYILIGYSYNVKKTVFNVGLGVGYGFGSIRGDNLDVPQDGITALLDMNLGYKF